MAVSHYRAVLTCHCQVGFRWGVLDLRWCTSDRSWFFFVCPAQNDLSVPLLEEDLDGSSGLLFPVYDSDTHMLYVVGKVSAFHISKCRPVWFCCQPVLWQTEVKDAPEAVNLRIWADGVGPEGSSSSGHIYHLYRCTMFIVERYAAGS